jgi:hypothetical protein
MTNPPPINTGITASPHLAQAAAIDAEAEDIERRLLE